MAFKRKSQEPTNRRVATGNQAPSTYLYHNKRSESSLENGRDVNRTLKKQTKTVHTLWLEKFGFILLAITVGVCLVSILYLSKQSVVIFEPPSSGGPSFTNYRQAVENSASKLIASSILNRNKITFDSQKVTTTLEDEYPMFSDISITLPLIDHHPVIYLTPSKPVLVLNYASNQYLVNQYGQIILSSPTSSGLNSSNLPQIDYSGNSISNGDRVLTGNEVQFIQTVAYELGLKNLQVSHMNLPQGTSELDVYIKGLNYYVKFNLQNSDARQQVGSFLASWHYLEEQGTTPSQYIDVRTDGRVYYQ